MRCEPQTDRASKKVLRLNDLDHLKRTVLNTRVVRSANVR